MQFIHCEKHHKKNKLPQTNEPEHTGKLLIFYASNFFFTTVNLDVGIIVTDLLISMPVVSFMTLNLDVSIIVTDLFIVVSLVHQELVRN